MPALNPNDVLADASCYVCYGASTVEALELGLLHRWSTAPLDSFIERAGLTDPTQIAAVTALFESAVEHGWWAKCDLIYPFVGGNATAHAQNLKSSSFTITWNGTVTHDANGITGNGTTGYGDTGYVPSVSGLISLNNAHLSVYRRTFGTSVSRIYLGCDIAGPHRLGIGRGFGGTSLNCVVNNANITTAPSAVSLALNMTTRINDAANLRGYSGSVDGNIVNASTSIPTVSCYVLASNSSGVATVFSNANLAGVTAGSAFTFAEYQVMEADWQTFQTSLGRQV